MSFRQLTYSFRMQINAINNRIDDWCRWADRRMKGKWEQFKKAPIEKSFFGFLAVIRWLAWDLTGLHAIYCKIVPSGSDVSKHRPPTITLWAIGIYVAFFGLSEGMYQRYMNSIYSQIDVIANQACNKDLRKNALAELPNIQWIRCPQKPVFFNPISVVASVFGKQQPFSQEVIERTISVFATNRSFLDGINMYGVRLPYANLQKANLKEAYLTDADLRWADLQEAHLESANLKNAKLHEADMERANLYEANMTGAKMERVDLRWAEMTFADANGAILIGADLRDATLTDVRFIGANLQEANLKGASLLRADFTEADLTDVQGVTVEQLSKCSCLYRAKLPPEIRKQLRAKWPQRFTPY